MIRNSLYFTKSLTRIGTIWARKKMEKLPKLFLMGASLIFAKITRIRRWVWPRTIKSHPASKALRPVFESKKVKTSFGLALILLVLLSRRFDAQAAAFNQFFQEEGVILEPEEIQVRTDQGVQAPLDDFLVTQGYWFFHKALDLAAPWGTKIKPIMEGEVVGLSYGGWPWGKTIKIDHGSDWQSFYAHLSEINVKIGEQVAKESIIGKVGSTGQSTGDHLHLEVYLNGEAINPADFISP